MANWFYINKSGEKVGPISTAALKALAQQGVISPETVIENQNGRSAKAGQVNGLEFPLPVTPAPPAPIISPPVQYPISVPHNTANDAKTSEIPKISFPIVMKDSNFSDLKVFEDNVLIAKKQVHYHNISTIKCEITGHSKGVAKWFAKVRFLVCDRGGEKYELLFNYAQFSSVQACCDFIEKRAAGLSTTESLASLATKLPTVPQWFICGCLLLILLMAAACIVTVISMPPPKSDLETQLRIAAEDSVRQRLKYPKEAVFDWSKIVTKTKDDGNVQNFTVQGTVKTQNAFGATYTQKYIVLFVYYKDKDGYKVVSCLLDDDVR